MLTNEDRCKLVDTKDKETSISQQCRMFEISRSRLYYSPTEIFSEELRAMRLLDELYLEDPCRSTRRMCRELIKLGVKIGRTKTRTLMQRMRLKTVYCRPRTTIIDPAE